MRAGYSCSSESTSLEELDSVSEESARPGGGTTPSFQVVHFTVASSGLSESPPVITQWVSMQLYGVSWTDHDEYQQLTHGRVYVGAHGGMHVVRRALLILVKGLRQELAVGHEALYERHCATNSLCESPTCLYLDFGRVPVLRQRLVDWPWITYSRMGVAPR